MKNKRTQSEVQQAIDFSERVRNVDLWVRKAEDLLAAASVLAKEVDAWWTQVVNDRRAVNPGRPNVQAVYMMVAAYAIENYCKALLVHDHREDLHTRLLTEIPGLIKKAQSTRLATDGQGGGVRPDTT